MTWEGWVTLGIAIAGLVLSVYNTFAAHLQHSSRLHILEDYRPVSADGQSPPKYELRLENRGQIPIGVESIAILIDGRSRSIEIGRWPDIQGQKLELLPHRVLTFQLPVNALYNAVPKRKAWIVVKTETAGEFKKRARAFWNIVADYGIAIEHARRRPRGSTIPS